MASEIGGEVQRLDANKPAHSPLWRLITWGPLMLVAGGIFAFSSRPSFGQRHALLNLMTGLFGESAWFVRYYGVVVAIDPYSAPIAHFFEYAILAIVAYWALSRQFPTQPYIAAYAFAVAALYAISDELHQYFVPGRHCDWRDVATDWLGAAFALLVVAAVVNRRGNGWNRRPH